jgi:hypothetical protein
MTASWVIEAAKKNPGSMETCAYYDNFQASGEATTMPSGIYDLEELKKWGKSRGWCPYYLTRQVRFVFIILNSSFGYFDSLSYYNTGNQSCEHSSV